MTAMVHLSPPPPLLLPLLLLLPWRTGTAFVLVAGGLGERLGYSGIKVALPTETTTGIAYLQFYLTYFLR